MLEINELSLYISRKTILTQNSMPKHTTTKLGEIIQKKKKIVTHGILDIVDLNLRV